MAEALRGRWDERRAGGDKIVRRKLSDQVLERMQELILSGEIAAGRAAPVGA